MVVRNTTHTEDCVFRLDYNGTYNCTNLPVTYKDVGLGTDGFEFNGSSSYISSKLVNAYLMPSVITIESITKIDSELSGLRIIAGMRGGAHNYSMDLDAGNKIRFGLYAASNHELYTDVNAFNIGEFVHIVGTYDGTNQVIYVNGNEVKTSAWSDTLKTDTNYSLGIGSLNGNSTTALFNGTIKHVSIYNRALTAAEVKDRYKQRTYVMDNNLRGDD